MNLFKASDEFKKNPELKEEDLNHLKEWISKQPHLPHVTDELLILFMHSCFYRLEFTKITIDSYFTLRTHSPEFFTKRNTEEKSVLEAFKTMPFCVIPEPTPDGDRVILSNIKRTEPELFVLSDLVKTLSMTIDMLLMTSGTFNGLIIIYDIKGVILGHAGRFSLNILKKYILFLQEGLPVRLKGIHVLNTSPIVDMILNLMKPFMKKELFEKMNFHKAGSQTIFDHNIPKEILPIEIGGTGKPLNTLYGDTFNELKEMKKWFLDEEQLRVDEKKRPGKPKTERDYFGVDGSFKALDMD